MIHFKPVPKPADFHAKVEVRGSAWLKAHPNAKERPKDFWSPFKGALQAGFSHLCAYSAMYEPVGTVDHFVSCHEDRSRGYEWANYRYAAGWINSSKQNIRSNQILDPFEIQDEWFQVILPSLQLVLTDKVPAAKRDQANFVLKRLHLRDDEPVIRQRREWYRMYQDGEITLEGLGRKAPLIARAIVRGDG